MWRYLKVWDLASALGKQFSVNVLGSDEVEKNPRVQFLVLFLKSLHLPRMTGVLSVSFGTKAAVLGSDDIVEIFFLDRMIMSRSVTLHVMS